MLALTLAYALLARLFKAVGMMCSSGDAWLWVVVLERCMVVGFVLLVMRCVMHVNITSCASLLWKMGWLVEHVAALASSSNPRLRTAYRDQLRAPNFRTREPPNFRTPKEPSCYEHINNINLRIPNVRTIEEPSCSELTKSKPRHFCLCC